MPIYYLCPDYAPPSGGVKRIYTHVEALLRNGFDAHVVHQRSGFRPGWFDTAITPLAFDAGIQLTTRDWIVVPDGIAHVLPRLPGSKHVLLVLNPYYMLRQENTLDILKIAPQTRLMTNSQTMANFMNWLFGRNDTLVVDTGVDSGLFHPNDKPPFGTRTMPIRIAFTRRKDTASDMAILLARQILDDRTAPIEVMDLNDLSLTDYAANLRRADIWLTTALEHGFPRSTLEAMACGCLCMGFTGVCGKDIIDPDTNFIAVPDGDLFALTKKLVQTIGALARRSPKIEKTIAGGIETANACGLEREEQNLVDIWKELTSISTT
ncbi:glycosyltransferase [Desulfoplanes sp.]